MTNTLPAITPGDALLVAALITCSASSHKKEISWGSQETLVFVNRLAVEFFGEIFTHYLSAEESRLFLGKYRFIALTLTAGLMAFNEPEVPVAMKVVGLLIALGLIHKSAVSSLMRSPHRDLKIQGTLAGFLLGFNYLFLLYLSKSLSSYHTVESVK